MPDGSSRRTPGLPTSVARGLCVNVGASTVCLPVSGVHSVGPTRLYLSWIYIHPAPIYDPSSFLTVCLSLPITCLSSICLPIHLSSIYCLSITYMFTYLPIYYASSIIIIYLLSSVYLFFYLPIIYHLFIIYPSIYHLSIFICHLSSISVYLSISIIYLSSIYLSIYQ